MMDDLIKGGMMKNPKMMRDLLEMGVESGLSPEVIAEYKRILNGPEDEVEVCLKWFTKELKRLRDEGVAPLSGAAKTLDDEWRIPHHTDRAWEDAEGFWRRKRTAFGREEPDLTYTYVDRIWDDETCRPYFDQVVAAGFKRGTPRFYEELLCLVEGCRVELRHVLCQLDNGYLIKVLGFRMLVKGEEESHEEGSKGESAS